MKKYSDSGNLNRDVDGGEEESKQVESSLTSLSPAVIDGMNTLSDQLIEQRKQLKPPANYPQRENISGFREA
jgi:hypothetical protein